MRPAVATIAAVLLLALGAPVAHAQDDADPTPEPTTSASAQPEDDGPKGCDRLPPGARHLCDAATGVIGGGVGAVAAGTAEAALSAVVTFVVDGAGWLLGQVAAVVDATTRPEVTAGWFRASYRDMAAVAVLGLLPFLLLAIIQALVRQDPGMLLRSTFGMVPLAAIGTAAAVVVVDMLVSITDQLSGWVGRSVGADLSAFATGVGDGLAEFGLAASGVSGFAALLGAGVVAFATFVVWLELLLRQAAIYVAVLFLPLGFMAMVWPATAHWLRRLAQGLVAIVLSKFVIVAVMALASTALDAQVADEGYGTVLAGAALLSMAALSPYVLLRLIPVFEAGMASTLEGTLRRPTAAVGAPVHPGQSMSRLLRQHVAGPGGGGGGGAGGPAASGIAADGHAGSAAASTTSAAPGASGLADGAGTAGAAAGGVATAGTLAAVGAVGSAGSSVKRRGSAAAAGTADTVRTAAGEPAGPGTADAGSARAGTSGAGTLVDPPSAASGPSPSQAVAPGRDHGGEGQA